MNGFNITLPSQLTGNELGPDYKFTPPIVPSYAQSGNFNLSTTPIYSPGLIYQTPDFLVNPFTPNSVKVQNGEVFTLLLLGGAVLASYLAIKAMK